MRSREKERGKGTQHVYPITPHSLAVARRTPRSLIVTNVFCILPLLQPTNSRSRSHMHRQVQSEKESGMGGVVSEGCAVPVLPAIIAIGRGCPGRSLRARARASDGGR